MAYKSVPRTNRILTSMFWDNAYFSLTTSWKSTLMSYLFKYYFSSFYSSFWTNVFWNLNFFYSKGLNPFPTTPPSPSQLCLQGSRRRMSEAALLNFAISKFWCDKWRTRFFIPGELFIFSYSGALHIIVTFYKATPIRYAVASVPATMLCFTTQKNFFL